MPKESPRVIALVGTNASGKTELGVGLAVHFNGEIVSADSRQVYRGFDLAAGKPSPRERRKVPHHLIDVASIEIRFSLADYQRLAYTALDDIIARGRNAFIVGGTGLYVRSVVDGYQLTDVKPDLSLRNALEKLSDVELWELLKRQAPQAATQIDPRNRRRIIRGLEIVSSGHEFRTFHTNNPRYNVLQLGLTWPRDELRRRIMVRLRRRITAGMVGEFQAAVENGVTHAQLESLGLEYKFISRYIRGEFRDEEELIDQLGHAIYRFAVRQIAWFRHDPSIVWLDVRGNYEHEAVSRIATFLSLVSGAAL
jgi:tRNA dimethylallyltransferase